MLLPTLMGLIFLALVVHVYWGPNMLESKRQHVIGWGEEALQTLASGISYSLLAGDLAAVYGILDESMASHKTRWRSLVLVDSEDKRLYPLEAPTAVVGPGFVILEHTLRWKGERLAKLSLTLDVESMLADERNRIKQLELYTLLVFGLIGLGGILWQNVVIRRPLLRLEKAVGQLARGDFAGELPKSGNDELGRLTRSFEFMRTNMQLANDNLQSAADSARANEIRQRTVLNNIGDGIITLSDRGVIQSFNPAAEDIFGYSAQEVNGESLTLLLHTELKVEALLGRRYLAAGRRLELHGLRKNGEVFPLELSINQMRIGHRQLFTMIARDIAERHRIDRLKNEFVSTVSHELRTPLTSIHGALGLINGGALGEVPENIREMLQLAANNSNRLLLLVNDILDIQKIEAGELDFDFVNVDAYALLQQAVKDHSVYAAQHDVTFVFDGRGRQLWVHADRNRIMQALSNLMSNAVKFSPRHGVVELAMEAVGSMVRISVIDSGPGIPEEFQSKLFDKFTQADSSDARVASGTGLGLSICKAIVEKHGGSIGYERRPRGYSCFYMDLPAARSTRRGDAGAVFTERRRPRVPS